MEQAFKNLIEEVYEKMKQGSFDDKLEQFNYFGNDRIRQQAIEQIMNQQNDSVDQGDNERKGGRKRAVTGF